VTPTAAALLARIRADRRFWDDMTQGEQTTHTRYQAIARRDLLDNLLQSLPRDLEAVEEEAAQEERGVASWLDEGAGIGVLSLPAEACE
jgi:hypothetical protein